MGAPYSLRYDEESGFWGLVGPGQSWPCKWFRPAGKERHDAEIAVVELNAAFSAGAAEERAKLESQLSAARARREDAEAALIRLEKAMGVNRPASAKPAAPTDTDLLKVGYAPGNYSNSCVFCGRNASPVDKRCFCCRECAAQRWLQVERDTKPAAAESRAEKLARALEKLKNWRTPAVLGEGDYHRGLLCGVEDNDLQHEGYNAMRWGYDRALERVAEEIDETISSALSASAGGEGK